MRINDHNHCDQLIYWILYGPSKTVLGLYITMFDGISKKINLLMAKEGISGMQLARKLGIPASTIKKIRSKEITNPTVATLAPIARYFSVTLDYLLGATDDFNSSLPSGYGDVRLISWEEVLQFHRASPEISMMRGYDNYALLVEADDEAIFPSASIVIVDSTVQPKHCDFVITAKNEYSKAILKQFLCVDGESYLRSLNNVVPLTSEYSLLGVVMEFHKEFKDLKRSEKFSNGEQ